MSPCIQPLPMSPIRCNAHYCKRLTMYGSFLARHNIARLNEATYYQQTRISSRLGESTCHTFHSKLARLINNSVHQCHDRKNVLQWIDVLSKTTSNFCSQIFVYSTQISQGGMASRVEDGRGIRRRFQTMINKTAG